MTALAYAAAGLTLAGCGAYAFTVLRGHRLSCWRRSAGIGALIAATLLAIAAVRVIRAARHPLLHARYTAVRTLRRRRHPRRSEAEPLEPGEAVAFIAICRGWKHPARSEGSRT